MDFVGAILESITCMWRCISPHVVHASELENNLESLRWATEELRHLSEDVRTRVELTEMQLSVFRTRKQVEGWLKRAEIIERQANRILEKGEREIQSKCLWGRCSRNCCSSFMVGGKVRKMLAKVKEEQSKGCFEVVADELPFEVVEERPLANTVGLDSTFQRAWNCINGEETSIIGLYGLGGVGKTTLLAKINNEFIARKSFNLVIWIGLSKQARTEEVQEVIYNRMNLKDDNWHKKGTSEKAATIHKLLKAKKFVLLLDDVRERLDLLQVGVPPPDGKNQCKIVFTTRSLEVCGLMEAHTRIKVTCLAKPEARTLFEAKVGEETMKSHPEIGELSPVICKECDGLPLAIIAIGRAMAGKKDPREWRRAIEILKNSPSKFSCMKDHVFSVLRFSYDSLSNDTLKQCFLYSSIFAEAYDIPMDNLIELWIGEGLIHELDDIDEARNQGMDIIGKLKSACLLETGLNKDTVKMHDVIRDMALWIACDDMNGDNRIVVEQHTRKIESVQVVKWTNAKRVSVFRASGIYQSPTCPRLLTLLIRDCNFVKLPSTFLQQMPTLTVLDLSGNHELNELPLEITILVNLQYLNLSRTNIETLPSELGNLTKMRHLLLNSVALAMIPKEVIAKFLSLRVLSMNNASVDDYLDQDIENNVLSCGKEPLLQELEEASQHLQDLCIVLTTQTSVCKLLSSEKLRRSIRNLHLKRCEGMNEIAVSISSVEQMEKLEKLEVRNCRDLTQMIVHCSVSDQVQGFRSLRAVTITDCKMVEMTWLMHTPALESLHLQGCKLLEQVICDSAMLLDFEKHQRVFSRLINMTLFDLPKLEIMCPRSLPLTSLENIRVTLCPSLKKLPLNSRSAKNRLKEIEGWPSWWNMLEWEDDETEVVFRDFFRASR